MTGKGHGGGYHRSTDDGAVVQSRQEEIPLQQGSASNGTQTAKHPDTQKYSGSHYSYSSYY